jgi:hypothetical protein
MIGDDMKKISRRHFVNIGMQKLSAKRRLRHRQRGFQQPYVPDARRTTVFGNLRFMYPKYFLLFQKSSHG